MEIVSLYEQIPRFGSSVAEKEVISMAVESLVKRHKGVNYFINRGPFKVMGKEPCIVSRLFAPSNAPPLVHVLRWLPAFNNPCLQPN